MDHQKKNTWDSSCKTKITINLLFNKYWIKQLYGCLIVTPMLIKTDKGVSKHKTYVIFVAGTDKTNKKYEIIFLIWQKNKILIMTASNRTE